MPNPARLLSHTSIGQQKSRHENSLLLFRGVNFSTRSSTRYTAVYMHDSASHVDLQYTLRLSEQFERDRSCVSHIHDIVDVQYMRSHGRTDLHRSYMYIMIVHVRPLVLLAASAAWPDKKREPNDRRQATDDKRKTTDRQVSFYRYMCA